MTFKTRVKKFGTDYLLPKGFTPTHTWGFQRKLEGLTHGFSFQKGIGGAVVGKYTAHVYIHYNHSSKDSPGSMDCHRPVEDWFRIEDDDGYQRLGKYFERVEEPFLQEHSSIQAILSSYENQRFSEKMLFGADPGWFHFNLGYCYLWVGNQEGAAKHLRIVIDQYSKNPRGTEWIETRKRIANEGLKRATS
jgi:hypothetical protein